MAFKVFGKLPAGTRLDIIKNSPNYAAKSFQNPVETVMAFTPATAYDTVRQRMGNKELAPKTPLPTIQTNLSALAEETPTIVWFGHSSYLINYNNTNILVDPVFGKYASPIPGTVGSYPHSYKYTAADMPDIDVLVITHDHFDHLDYPTIVKLLPKVKKVVTGLGTGAHFEYWGYKPEIITELDWWQGASVGPYHFTYLPGRHFSGRTFKRNQSMWGAFALQMGNYRMFLGGDSGYGAHFKKIGAEFGSFDIAILECGQYNQNWRSIHMMPEETVQAAKDLNSKLLLPVHWAKFTLAVHPWYEGVTRALDAGQNLNMPIATPQIGQTLNLLNHNNTQNWWL